RQWLGKIMRDDLGAAVVRKTLSQRREHWLRKIERHAFRRRTFQEKQAKQPAITRAEIENSFRTTRNFSKQRFFALGAMGELVSPPKIGERMLDGLPFTCHKAIFSRSAAWSGRHRRRCAGHGGKASGCG